ncbi:hypothetical protein D3C75_903920 [compost metagenome]
MRTEGLNRRKFEEGKFNLLNALPEGLPEAFRLFGLQQSQYAYTIRSSRGGYAHQWRTAVLRCSPGGQQPPHQGAVIAFFLELLQLYANLLKFLAHGIEITTRLQRFFIAGQMNDIAEQPANRLVHPPRD